MTTIADDETTNAWTPATWDAATQTLTPEEEPDVSHSDDDITQHNAAEVHALIARAERIEAALTDLTTAVFNECPTCVDAAMERAATALAPVTPE